MYQQENLQQQKGMANLPLQQNSSGRSLVSHRLEVRNKTYHHPQQHLPNETPVSRSQTQQISVQQPSPMELQRGAIAAGGDQQSIVLSPAIPQMNRPPPPIRQLYDKQFNSNDNLLPIGSTWNAYITVIDDGPNSFSVQLKSHSEEIQPKIDAICNIHPPRSNIAPLLPGSHILGRCIKDGHFRRAVVMHVKTNACKVYYLDYGTTEELPQPEIYTSSPYIRDLAQPQAMVFCLAGYQTLNLPESSKDIFTRLVLNKQVLLRVTPNEYGSLTQSCEMFLDGKNVRDLLIDLSTPLEYTNQFPPRAREIPVNVSFVDCPTQFFVQYNSEINVLGLIQDSLATYCPQQERLQNITQVTIGSPIGSLYSDDNMWYRALVIGIDDNTVNVLYVDYGNRDNVHVNQLCYLNREIVTKWRSQAVECCLIGFENASPDPLLAQEMENRILNENPFVLQLHYLQSGNRLVVDLLNEQGQSIAQIMNEFSKQMSNQTSMDRTKKYQAQTNQSSSGVSKFSTPSTESNRAIGGDNLNEPKDRNFGRSTNPNTRLSYQRQQQHSEHDDRFNENYDNSWHSNNKKREDRNSSKGTNWREDCRRQDDGGSGESWENTVTKNKDRSSRGSGGSGGAAGDRERVNRYDSRNERRGGNKRDDDNIEMEKYNTERSEKFKDRRGERGSRGSGGSGGGRFNNSRNIEDDEKTSDHGSDSRHSGGEQRIGSGRFSDGKGGGNRSGGGGSGSGNRKFNDYDYKSGGGSGRFSNERSNRNRDGGDRGSGRRGGSGNFEKKLNKTSTFNSSTKDSQNSLSTTITSAVNESYDEWDTDKVPTNAATQAYTCNVREYPNMDIDIGETYDVYFSSLAAQPNDIYVQLDGCMPILNELREAVDKEETIIKSQLKNRLIPKNIITPGLPVLARFSDDQLLYRAVIRSYSSGNVTVLYVDYGNSAQVELNELYTTTPELAEKPVQALRVMLSDIKPINDKWDTDHTIYLPYYEDELLKLKVKNLKNINGELICIGSLTRIDNKTIAEKLIEDGLALAVNETINKSIDENIKIKQKEIQPIDINLLNGQKIRGIVLNKIDEKVYSIQLENSTIIECEINVEQIINDDLPNECKVIVDVVGVKEKRLLANIYDNNGNAFGKFSNGSKTVSKYITPICPMLIDNRVENVYISDFDGKLIYIQKSISIDTLNTLFHQLYERYNDTKPDLDEKWEIGQLCCVLSPEDFNWYRAKIIGFVESDEKFIISFIDYGNTVNIVKTNLRKLHPEFYSVAMCLAVQLPIVWQTSITNARVIELVDNQEFNCEYLKHLYDNIWLAELTFINTGEKLVEKLINEGLASVTTAAAPLTSVKLSNIDLPKFEIGTSVPIMVSHVDSPTMFWVQHCANINQLEELQEKLQNCAENLPSPDGAVHIFAAQYSEDEMWYRAVQVDSTDYVRFIDYGNTDLANSRKKLPDDLLTPEEGYALPMYLCVRPIDGELWSKEAKELFETFIERQIMAEIKNVDDNKILVDLKCIDDNQSLSNLLINGGHAVYIDFVEKAENISAVCELSKQIVLSPKKPKTTPPQPQIEENAEVLLLGFADCNNFYVQSVNDVPKQVKILEYLLNVDNFPVIDMENIEIGDIMVARNVMDNQWYRVKLINLDPFQGLTIDYGFIIQINEQPKQLPESLVNFPPLVMHCSFNLKVTQKIMEKFAIMSNDATKTYQLLIKERGEPNIIDLRLIENGKLFSQLLLAPDDGTTVPSGGGGGGYGRGGNKRHHNQQQQQQQLMDHRGLGVNQVTGSCIVSHANGPYDFYIQTQSGQTLVQYIQDKLSTTLDELVVIDKLNKDDMVAVQSLDDNNWYRCQIIETQPEICGHFIDYGNNTLVSEYRQLPENLKSLAPLAIKCSLALPEGVSGWSAEAVLKFTELVMSDEASINGFDVLVKSLDDPVIVELISCDKRRMKITEHLLKLCRPIYKQKPSSPTKSSLQIQKIEPRKNADKNDKNIDEVIDNSIDINDFEVNVSENIDQVNIKDKIDIDDFEAIDTQLMSGYCTVTHINTPKDFYIRDRNTNKYIEQITINLENFQQTKLHKYDINDLVIAQIDNGYYRGKITQTTPSLKVFLIDIGNIIETTMIFEIPESIKDLPIDIIQKSSLFIENIDKKPIIDNNIDEFINLLTTDNCEFNYKIINICDNSNEIELCLNEENIVNIIIENVNKKSKSILDTTTKQIIDTPKPIIESPKSKSPKPKKHIETIAETKANAKSKIVTRSISMPTVKSTQSSTSTTPSRTSTSSPIPKNIENNEIKTSKKLSNMKRSISMEDRIIPGCVSGYIDDDDNGEHNKDNQ